MSLPGTALFEVGMLEHRPAVADTKGNDATVAFAPPPARARKTARCSSFTTRIARRT